MIIIEIWLTPDYHLISSGMQKYKFDHIPRMDPNKGDGRTSTHVGIIVYKDVIVIFHNITINIPLVISYTAVFILIIFILIL